LSSYDKKIKEKIKEDELKIEKLYKNADKYLRA